MSNKTDHNQNGIPSHLEDYAIVAYLDGELSEEDKGNASLHLENCWSCRGKLKTVQDSIDNFMNRRQEILIPTELPPSEPALKIFQARLHDYKSQTKGASVFNLSGWRTKLKDSSLFSILKPLISLPVPARIGVVGLAVVVIAALLINQSAVQIVSASELLKNANEARKTSLNVSSEPVVHQKIQVRRTVNNAASESISWETWEDATRNKFREAVETKGVRRLVVETSADRRLKVPYILENERPPLLAELNRILALNRMNRQDPLAASSFETWRNSLRQKTEEVIKTVSESGDESYELKIARLEEPTGGQIKEAAYLVRAADWMPLKLKLEVVNGNETIGYEISRQTSEVVSLAALAPEIFPQIENASAPSPKISPKESPSASPAPEAELIANSNATPTVSTENNTKPVAATAELEVEVLKTLGGIGADIGEEATVTRTTSGELLVQGVVKNQQRKAEILSALAPLSGQPGLIVRIETSEEAQKRIERERTLTAKNKPARQNDQTVSVEPFEIRDQIPADTEVRRYLRSKGTTENLLTGEVNRFAQNALNRSNQILLRAQALKNLANRFSETQLRSMKPEARNQWLNLIARRAAEIKNQNAALRQELAQVFGAIPAGGESTELRDEADLKRAALRLSEMAAGVDNAVGDAFTFSSGASADAVKGAKFRQSLGSIEAIANSIESGARRLQTK